MITIDYETRSECDLIKCGAWIYSCHPTTEVLCMAYARDDGEVKLWKTGEPMPAEFSLDDEFEAHNSFFENSIWLNTLKWPKVKWSCSAAKCAAHSLPRALDKAGLALNLNIQKDQEGKRIMMKMCKPRKPTKHNPAKWHESAEDFATLYEYCISDVKAERALSHALRDLTPTEAKVWALDQKINERGIQVDVDAINAAIKISEKYTREANQQMSDITEGAVVRTSEAAKLANWINSHGIAIMDVRKETVAEVLDNWKLPDVVREALELRQSSAKTSVAKYKAMALATGSDGRTRGLLMYHGAGTGRWTGKLIQPQNLPRNSYKGDLETYFNILKTATPSSFEFCYPEVMTTISKLIRPCFMAPEGKTFFGGDYSSIEARVLVWIAGDEEALEVFRRDESLYKALSGEIYNMTSEDAQAMSKDDYRYMMGKQGILGLGYGMGHKKFRDTCMGYGMEVDEQLAESVVKTYREKYKLVVNCWYDQERAAIEAVRTGVFTVCGPIGWGISGDFLYCKLPSGRCLAYPYPKLQMTETPWGATKETLTYMGTNSLTRKWERERTYGGKIVENIAQAVARDIMAEAMLRIEAAGYDVVLTVHDEVMSENTEEAGSVEEFKELMCQLPSWGEGIPLGVDGWTNNRYIK